MKRGWNWADPEHRAGYADTQAWEVAPDYYDEGDAAGYHEQLEQNLKAEGWEDGWIAEAHVSIAEGVSYQAAGGYGGES